jgi:hypothetical protein
VAAVEGELSGEASATEDEDRVSLTDAIIVGRGVVGHDIDPCPGVVPLALEAGALRIPACRGSRLATAVAVNLPAGVDTVWSARTASA